MSQSSPRRSGPDVPQAAVARLPAARAGNVLTVAIATYNGRSLLETALPSLAAQSFRDFRVLVVDDASTDDTVAWLHERWPEVEVVVHRINLGIAAALNTCLRVPRSPLIGLFNNDVALDPGCLGELVKALSEHPEAGWAGGKLIDFRQRDVIDGAGDVFSWTRAGGRRGHGERDHGQYDGPRPIFGACGGAAVYRRAVLEDVGLFDEDFFAFYEDIDWDLRAQLAGFSCRYVPTAVVYHVGSATVGRGLSDFTRYHLWRNTVWLVIKDLPSAVLLRHAHQLLLGQLLNLAVAVRDRKLAIWWGAWRDALLGLPLALRKRRVIQERRRIDPRELESIVADDGAAAERKCSRNRARQIPFQGF
jgi:GT2 family glycosyltransferase